MTLRVTRDGKPVTDLQPYLGAYGHLVAIRARRPRLPARPPRGRSRQAPRWRSRSRFDKPGDYRLFFDFQHDGGVRTAAFTVRAGGHGEGGHEH